MEGCVVIPPRSAVMCDVAEVRTQHHVHVGIYQLPQIYSGDGRNPSASSEAIFYMELRLFGLTHPTIHLAGELVSSHGAKIECLYSMKRTIKVNGLHKYRTNVGISLSRGVRADGGGMNLASGLENHVNVTFQCLSRAFHWRFNLG
jgi:hypothetical protein